MNKKNIFDLVKQIFRYGLVGLFYNLLGFGVYLIVTFFWLKPITAVKIMYPIAVLIGYFGHAKYTFRFQGSNFSSIFRYLLAHLIGYFTNLLLLNFFFVRLGFPHQLVQLVAIGIVGAILFLLFRYFVFPVRTF